MSPKVTWFKISVLHRFIENISIYIFFVKHRKNIMLGRIQTQIPDTKYKLPNYIIGNNIET